MKNHILRLSGLAMLLIFAWPIPGLFRHASNDPVILGRYDLDWVVFGVGYLLFVGVIVAANVWLWRAIRRERVGLWAERLHVLYDRPWLLGLVIVVILSSGTVVWRLILDRGATAQIPGLEHAIRFGPVFLAVPLLVLKELPDSIRPLRIVALFVFGVLFIRTAWVTEDAYITYRTISNFVDGYGLTWNIGERVQAYTHPLWMFFVTGVYAITHQMFYSSIFLSIGISLATIAIFAFGMTETPQKLVIGAAILGFSKAFVQYSTSGLENPLTHLLLIAFLYIYYRDESVSPRRLLLLALLTSLATLNRMDAVLLFLPALIYMAVRLPSWKGLGAVVIGFLPVVLWEIFSIWYYGFPFPNTGYAKLHTGIDGLALLPRGVGYFQESLLVDPLTLLAIVIGIIVAFAAKKPRFWPVALGVALWLGYVLRIGGDFMSGRFFSAPLLAIVASLPEWSPSQSVGARWGWVPVTVAVAALGIWGIHAGMEARDEPAEMVLYVEDEWRRYYNCAGLLTTHGEPNCFWVWEGKTYTEAPPANWAAHGQTLAENVVFRAPIGYFGYYAPREVYILDELALADPLLARLPVCHDEWHAGHYGRAIPAGYVETLATGQNQIQDKDLAAYYDKLMLITRGDLFDPERLIAIWKMNTGQYDYLLAGVACTED